jgi:hypothetical protein
VQIAGNDVGTLAGKGQYRSAADAGGGTGDEDLFALQ